jgi:hypothetical protein
LPSPRRAVNYEIERGSYETKRLAYGISERPADQIAAIYRTFGGARRGFVRLQKLSTSAALFRKNAPDYVIRGFDASPARLKKPQGLDLRWDIALRDLQVQLEP